MYVLAVDPGGTTGMCLVKPDLGELNIVNSDDIPLEQLSPYELTMWFDADLVIMESIVATGRLTAGKIEQIKAAERILYESESRSIPVRWTHPTASQHVKLTTKMQQVVRHKHARDALRNLIVYLREEGFDEADLEVTQR